MSQENVELVRRATEAFNRGDVDGFVATAHPNVEWEARDVWTERLRTYRGRDELRSWFAAQTETWEHIHLAITEMIGSRG